MSVLGCVETTAASAIWIYLLVTRDWLLPKIWLLVPLLALSTDRSVRESQVWLARHLKRSGRVVRMLQEHESDDHGGFFWPIDLAIGVILARLVPGLRNIVFNFWASVASLPRNWFRICVCTDVVHVPELVEGIESSRLAVFDPYRSSRIPWSLLAAGRSVVVRRAVRKVIVFNAGGAIAIYLAEGWPGTLVATAMGIFAVPLILLALVVTVFLSPYLFRFAFKATAPVYFPFLWAVQSTITSNASDRHILEDVETLQAFQRKLSWGLLGAAAMLCVGHTMKRVGFEAEKVPLALFQILGHVRLGWFVVGLLVAASALTLGAGALAKYALHRVRQRPQEYSLVRAARLIRAGLFLRGLLASTAVAMLVWNAYGIRLAIR